MGCLVCGGVIKKRYDKPPRPPSKYCSVKCRKVDKNVALICKCCGKEFVVPKARQGTAKYCSKECFDITQTIYEKKLVKCHHCGKDVETHKDNRRSKKIYCDKECFESSRMPAIKSECPVCKKTFNAKYKRGKYQMHCSPACLSESTKESVSCSCCGKDYSRPKRVSGYGRSFNVCSRECMTKHNRGSRATAWNHENVYISNDCVWVRTTSLTSSMGCGGWVQEHRKVVAEYIGRPLVKGEEQILHINGNNLDNRLSNLYVCANNSEMATIIHNHAAPYPCTSNVEILAAKHKIDTKT